LAYDARDIPSCPTRRSSDLALRVMQPLPQLGTGDFRRRRVFHEMVERHATLARKPGGDVIQRHADIAADAFQGDVAARRFAQVRSEEHTSELQSRENLVCRL